MRVFILYPKDFNMAFGKYKEYPKGSNMPFGKYKDIHRAKMRHSVCHKVWKGKRLDNR